MPATPLTVWKFPILPADTIVLEMPAGARLLHVAEQRGEVCLWALVNPSEPMHTRYFRMAGTGHPIETPASMLQHVGSWLMHGGALVFHLFEIV